MRVLNVGKSVLSVVSNVLFLWNFGGGQIMVKEKGFFFSKLRGWWVALGYFNGVWESPNLIFFV